MKNPTQQQELELEDELRDKVLKLPTIELFEIVDDLTGGVLTEQLKSEITDLEKLDLQNILDSVEENKRVRLSKEERKVLINALDNLVENQQDTVNHTNLYKKLGWTK